jgi:steroid 5-alpha reductase family enzyme
VTSFAVHPFLTGLAVTFGVTLTLFLLSWLLALAVGRYNVVDTLWGLSFAAVAVTSFIWSAGHGVPTWRRALVLVLVVVWALRLATYIGVRSRGKGEDPRYDALIGDSSGAARALRALGIVFVLQAVIAWFVSLPVQAAMYIRTGPVVLAVVGTLVWGVGLFFEAVGDQQMARFKADPANRGSRRTSSEQVMDTGLWRYTRHPNYFGDATVWVGLWLIAAEHWIGVLTIGSPVLMTWFLFFKSGKPLLERTLSSSRPGYAEYVNRTSGWFPLPPKGDARGRGTLES